MPAPGHYPLIVMPPALTPVLLGQMLTAALGNPQSHQRLPPPPKSQWLWQEHRGHHCPALASAAQWCHPPTPQSSGMEPGEVMEVFE